VYDIVRQNLAIAVKRNKRYYVNPIVYKPGDRVYYYNPRKFVDT